MPSILSLNDQGGRDKETSEDVTGTLRSQMKGHPPLVLFENHGIDSRYTGPLSVAPTMSARYGTGGNNLPLVTQAPDSYCIAGNIIDRKTENGGNGFGCQTDVSYTLNTADSMRYSSVSESISSGRMRLLVPKVPGSIRTLPTLSVSRRTAQPKARKRINSSAV